MKVRTPPQPPDVSTPGESPEPVAWVPIVVLALELGEPVARLAGRLGDALTVDDIGMRVVTADTARAVLDADRNRRAAARQASLAQAQRRRTASASRRDAKRSVAAPTPAAPGVPLWVSALAAMTARDIDALPQGGIQGEFFGGRR